MRAGRSAAAVLAVALTCLVGCSKSDAPSEGTTGTTPGPTTSAGPVDTSPSVGTSSAVSPAGTSSAVSPAGTPGAITLHVTTVFTSPYQITDSYDWTFDPTDYAEDGDDSPAPASCADLATLGTRSGGQGNPPVFQTPIPPGDGTMASGQNSLTLQADVDEYAGPRTYTGADVDGTSGLEISNTPTLPENGAGDLTFGDVEQKSSITVNADGSGATTIVGWQDAGSRTASGTLTWTCSG